MSRLPMPFDNPYDYGGRHTGIDFSRSAGTRFRASGPGRIAKRGSSANGGNILWVEYDGVPFGVGYAHMNDWTDSPPVGSRVVEGQVIGRVGYSGNVHPPGAAGAHVHVEYSGNPTPAGFWRIFDSSRVVGVSAAASVRGNDDMPLSEEDKAWLRLMVRQEVDAARGITIDDKHWARLMVRQEIDATPHDAPIEGRLQQDDDGHREPDYPEVDVHGYDTNAEPYSP